ncbi:MAG: insulinase family protein [Acidimicrobiia bacterium]|nr:insulinase family protein [Acidimicrobiia bacterium]MBT8192074.1 insulinase family protein [Acidimicrobiia bacterium]NNF87049.1 insulinase family protein [Acidimicrobiia bacterium]RZV47299.1 MAG: insulinase family protein [Acidimicrobiia bacterium]
MTRFQSIRLTALVVALVATACSSESGDSSSTIAPVSTTTSSAASATTTTTVPGVAMPVFADDDEMVAVDPDVTIGMLENGLTYYIRRNTRPGTRAQLRLAVAAGSALEDDDQRGVAHYLEHMMFNGTESFPANELVRVLERFGSEFGPDINAYTSLDQTVYELEVPTDTDGILETAIDVLFEWSNRATIDPVEVDAERGVMLEEWRLRSQSFFGRYFDEVSDVLLAGSSYEGHDPLADEDELAVTSVETLQRFYRDWYRPDLMAVVAVGDFDVDEVEQLIRTRFEALEPPSTIRPRPELAAGSFSEPGFVVLTDPESPNAFVELNYPLPALDQRTIGSARQELALVLAFDMIVTRLDEDSRRGDTSFFNPSFAANPFVDGQRTPGLAASADPSDLVDTAAALLEEVRRALLHGFRSDELERAVAGIRSQVELEFESVRTKQDGQYAEDYVAHFLTGTPIPSAESNRDLAMRLLEETTPEQVTETFRATIQSTAPLVIVAGPEFAAADIPDEATLRQVVAEAAVAELEERAADEAGAEQLMVRPDPVEIVSRSQLVPLAPTVLELANGVRVAYVESDIAADAVAMQATSPGGWLLLPDEDVLEAQLIGSIVFESGVAGFDQVALARFLSGEVAQVFTSIEESRETIVGSAESDDLELLFQLIHLYFVEPRADGQALDALVGELRPLATDRDRIPFLALADQVLRSRYGGDARYLPIPSVEDLDAFDLARAIEIQQERFADASDFVFTFAGDFTAGELEDLASRYLGTLPGGGEPESAGTGQPEAPDGVVYEVVDSGDGALGAVFYQFSQEIEATSEVRLTVPLLESILNQRLTALLREDLGATYSPFVTIAIQDEPIEIIEAIVEVSGDPDGLQPIADALLTDLADLAGSGPTADEMAIAVEQTVRDYELIGNQFWLDLMTRYVPNPDLDPGEVADRIPDTMSLTSSDVRALAAALLTLDDYIRVDLVPVG